ncbi:MAG: ATP-binding protein [Xanthomonadales bacterium]|nr:ATP-binding protein [Xanthomonadales bacterium]
MGAPFSTAESDDGDFSLDDLDDLDLSDLDVLDEAQPRGYEPVPLATPLDREGALLAARMLVGTGWYHRLFQRGHMRDHDVLTLLGLEESPDAGSAGPAGLRDAVEAQLRTLQRRRPRRDHLGENIARMGRLLHFGRTECALLRVLVISSRAQYMQDFYRLVVTSEQDFLQLLRHATGCRMRDVTNAWRLSTRLRSSGLLEAGGPRPACPTGVDEEVAERLLATTFDERQLLRHLVRPAPAAQLGPDDFGHLPEAALVMKYLGHALARRTRGVNILLHGAPGTGKTEFARMLAGPLRASVSEVPNCDSDGDPVSGSRRFRAFATCQNLLAGRRRQILLFDEVEDVFGSGGGSGFLAMLGIGGRDADHLRKAWVNETLESNPVPTIWTCNSIEAMDPAYLRRFDMVVEFRAPGIGVRRAILDRYFQSGAISGRCMERLAGLESLAPAQVERAARVVQALRARNQAERDACAERLVESALRAMGLPHLPAPTVLPEHYDPAFLNADRDLDALTRGLAHSRGARLCLYGPPGTGKTGFAHHLARELDRPLLVRRGSDLINKYIGETEKRIAAAFAQAASENAILVIDEADGFLRDRAGAVHSWEVTHVNELLTQMEAFDGLFIASTNLVETLDAASLRRFDFKIRFDAMTRAQRRAMLLRVTADARETPDTRDAALARLDRLEHLTPGDFANVLRQLRVTGEAATAPKLVDLLAAEQGMKPEGRHRSIGFGIN